jgi:hypothetical protein
VALCDKVWLFSPVSSTNKTDLHDIAEILLKVALNTINQTNQLMRLAEGNYKVIIFLKNVVLYEI